MRAMASRITSLTILYSSVCSGADKRKHQGYASLAFVRGIHRWPGNTPHKCPVTWNMFSFDDVIMSWGLFASHFYKYVDHHIIIFWRNIKVYIHLPTKIASLAQDKYLCVLHSRSIYLDIPEYSRFYTVCFTQLIQIRLNSHNYF